MLIVAMDANYRLRSKMRGLQTKDPTLALGWAYFVNNGPYADFIKEYVDQDEVRTTVMFAPEAPYLLYGADQDVRWVSSTSQHAYENVERSSRNWSGCSQLCTSPTFPSSWCRGFTKRRKVCFIGLT